MSYLCDRNRKDTHALIRSPLTAHPLTSNRSPLTVNHSPLIRSSAHHSRFLSPFCFLISPPPNTPHMSSVVNRQFVFSTDVLLL